MIQDLKSVGVSGLPADQTASVKGPFAVVFESPDFT